MSKLVIVESSGKIKKIQDALPSEFVVKSSNGHIRDLPENASELPEVYRSEPWAKLGVNIEDGFTPIYVNKSSDKAISELKKALKTATELYLATDGDREGEAISWHLLETLKPKIPTHRMVFREITREAILAAIKNTREVDYNLVEAQETRRILDRLIGYPLSILLGKKITYGLSAGRVQCPVIRLVVDRERERRAFKSGSYWDLKAQVITDSGQFEAQLYAIDDVRLATGADFDKDTGKIAEGKNVLLLGEKEAKELVKKLKGSDLRVDDIKLKPFETKPYPPFMTSTLQIEASNKLNLDASSTMSLAQKLYESGFITYMRTDSVALSNEAIKAARGAVKKLYGEDYLSPKVRTYTTKSKSGVQAQEAHEAIRPAGEAFTHPDHTGLRGNHLKLYDLIWKRTVASQMSNARKTTTTYELEVTIDGQKLVFRASGTTIDFAGYMRAYVEGSDDPTAALEDRDTTLPKAEVGDELGVKKVTPHGHETQPPPRYTQSSLQKRLESEGIGRPSTYATFYQKITDGRYGRAVGRAIVPNFTAFAVADFFSKHFPSVMELNFTADLETELDEIAEGEETKVDYLSEFYLGSTGFAAMIAKTENDTDRDDANTIELEGIEKFQIRVGPYGAYAVLREDPSRKVDVPDDVPPADITEEILLELLEKRESGPRELGTDPVTGRIVYVRVGRFGPFLTLGSEEDGEGKPKTSSITKDYDPETIELDDALKLLSLPRALGDHPDGGLVYAGLGRFGPYIRYKKDYRSIKDDQLFSIALEEAVKILAEPKQRGRGSAKVLVELGEHDGEAIQVLDGRYGPYVKMGKTNATLPKGTKPEEVTLEQAVDLIEAKRAKSPAKKTRKASTKKTTTKKSTAKKTTTKKATTKKSTAKKTTTKKTATKKTATKKDD